jgi:hypothetical protein
MKAMHRKMTLDEIKHELAEVARIGQVFVEGDLCRQAWKPHAVNFMKGDDMDYDPVPTVPLKKTLLRLEMLGRVPCCATLWRRRPDLPDRGEALLFGRVGSSPDGGDKPANRGYQPPMLSKELKQVFLKGKAAWKMNPKAHAAIRFQPPRGIGVAVKGLKASTTVQLLVPIKDSMGEIAAALEIHTIALAS